MRGLSRQPLRIAAAGLLLVLLLVVPAAVAHATDSPTLDATTSGASASFSLGAGSITVPTTSARPSPATTASTKPAPGGTTTSHRLVRDLVIALVVAFLLLIGGITGLVTTRKSRYGRHR